MDVAHQAGGKDLAKRQKQRDNRSSNLVSSSESTSRCPWREPKLIRPQPCCRSSSVNYCFAYGLFPAAAAAREQLTRINQLVRQIWAEIPTGTYVGYTATPFANIFMDPNDEEELYPADFIIDLPRPGAYFGAERVFGREPLEDADDPDLGLDMVRNVPDDDDELLKPPSKKDAR